jgi:hypothetical protein
VVRDSLGNGLSVGWSNKYTDLAWLKDPPATYFYPPHDVLGYLAKVKSNLQSGAYPNEEAFELDLYNVFAKAHDGHLVFYPDVLSNGLRWVRPTALVSVSLDGVSAPKIFLRSKFQLLVYGPTYLLGCVLG